MGIELTTFESLTLRSDDPLKLKYAEQQARKSEEIRIDFTAEDFVYPRTLGALSLTHTALEQPELLTPAA